VAGLHTPVAQQRACDWWNVRSVIGPYVRPMIGNGTCSVIGTNYNASFACNTHSFGESIYPGNWQKTNMTAKCSLRCINYNC
jgi:hypothetical protein